MQRWLHWSAPALAMSVVWACATQEEGPITNWGTDEGGSPSFGGITGSSGLMQAGSGGASAAGGGTAKGGSSGTGGGTAKGGSGGSGGGTAQGGTTAMGGATGKGGSGVSGGSTGKGGSGGSGGGFGTGGSGTGGSGGGSSGCTVTVDPGGGTCPSSAPSTNDDCSSYAQDTECTCGATVCTCLRCGPQHPWVCGSTNCP
jgi:hypothetical protein